MTRTHIALASILVSASAAIGDVVTLTPLADAFLSAAHPDTNYGGAGSLEIAAAGLPQGEFQCLLSFDTSTATATFNSSFGAGNWSVQSITLRLSAMNPANAIFNPQAAGEFGATRMQNTSWVEGTGMPNSPTTNGVTFSMLPGLIADADEPLGTFSFDGATSGSTTYPLALTSGFLADVASGGVVSFRLFPASASVAYLFNSRNFNNALNWPVLAVTAIASQVPCRPDFNADHTLNVQDIFDFLNAWFNSDPRSDFNGVGGITVQDIFDFLNAWFAGC